MAQLGLNKLGATRGRSGFDADAGPKQMMPEYKAPKKSGIQKFRALFKSEEKIKKEEAAKKKQIEAKNRKIRKELEGLHKGINEKTEKLIGGMGKHVSTKKERPLFENEKMNLYKDIIRLNYNVLEIYEDNDLNIDEHTAKLTVAISDSTDINDFISKIIGIKTEEVLDTLDLVIPEDDIDDNIEEVDEKAAYEKATADTEKYIKGAEDFVNEMNFHENNVLDDEDVLDDEEFLNDVLASLEQDNQPSGPQIEDIDVESAVPTRARR